jgi:elongation factor G
VKSPINSSRCITIVGPSQSGKTSLMEGILHVCKQIPNKGKVADNNTLSDHLPEEHELKMSISMGISNAQYMDEDFTFIDCPGSSEFINEFLQAIKISDLSIIVIEPIKEKILSLVPYFYYLNKMNIPHILFINKVDNLNFDIKELLGLIQEYSPRPLVIRQIPMREGDKIIGVADVIHERAYTYEKEKPSQTVKIPENLSSTRNEFREKVLEILADFDDALMEKILEDVPTSTEEIYEHLKKDIASNKIVEVLTGSAENGTGIRRLLKTIRHDCPVHEKSVERNGLKIKNDIACVQVFKTNFIPHRGKQSIVRLWSGKLKEGDTLQDNIRLQNLFSLKGKEFVKISKAKAGDIIGLSRIESIKTGDLIFDENKDINKDSDLPIPPQPIYAKAISTIKREDDVKLSESLKDIIETDSSYFIERNTVTQQLLIWGQGEIHLRIAKNKLKNNYNVETKEEKINFAFNETIQASVSNHTTTHKKQSGGAGQYARVVVDVKPLPRGKFFKFEDKIVGGVIPKTYIPSVEKGCKECMQKGPLGFPVTDIQVTLIDGKTHDVDSNSNSFHIAGVKALRETLENCKPILLEPFHIVKFLVPSKDINNIYTLVTSKRGLIKENQQKEGWTGYEILEAEIPGCEIFNLIIDVKSLTEGLGSFEHEFERMKTVQNKELSNSLITKFSSNEKTE